MPKKNIVTKTTSVTIVVIQTIESGIAFVLETVRLPRLRQCPAWRRCSATRTASEESNRGVTPVRPRLVVTQAFPVLIAMLAIQTLL
jgi:hypothetical protein